VEKMNLYTMLEQREKEGRRIRVGIIGAGKFGTMYISQIRKLPGVHLVGVADLVPENAFKSFERTSWPKEMVNASTLEEAAKNGTTCVLKSADELIASEYVDILIECTGNPEVGIKNVLSCCEYKKDIIMVNVEADAVAGPILCRKAQEAGIIYSLAYGDQPAIICEMVDWARTAGFEVVAAGKGTKYLPVYHKSTPDTIWNYYGLTEEQAKAGGLNPKMFNSFLDGTKSAIEMAAVSNATGLLPNPDGLMFPPCGADDLQNVLRPREDGGLLHHSGQVEVVSSLERDGRQVYRDLRFGVFVVVKADSKYEESCFMEYGILTDKSGKYASLYRPYHMIGLELGISVASVGLRREATGYPKSFNADVVATAKQNIKAGTMLDGEGGYWVYGKLMTAKDSTDNDYIPLGLCGKIKLKNDIEAGNPIRWSDVEFDEQNAAVKVRREMVEMYKKGLI
jgi:predicted homoserine dehydrogenase-like protein